MSKQETHLQQILYKDMNVQITEKRVKVMNFYFPQIQESEVLFKNINNLGLKEMDEMDEALGVSSQYFKDFKERLKLGRNLYIQITTSDESVRLCFAPDEPLKVLKLIEQKWSEAKKQKSGESQNALQENTLYTNVEVTTERIEQVMEQLKKSEQQDGEKCENKKKRSIEATSSRAVKPQEGQTPKKKVKEGSKYETENKLKTKEDLEAK